jgi:tellurite resistance protein
MAAGREFGRKTPPAVFTPVLGLLGLGLAWRRAAADWGAPQGVGDLVLGAAAALWLFAAVSYAAKGLARPGVIAEDARALPGRAGLAAAGMGGMALATALVPLSAVAAEIVLVLALFWHLAFAALLIRVMRAAPPEGRRVTPVWHLSFVGFIVAPLAAVPLGWLLLAKIVLVLTIPTALAIYAVSLRQLRTESPLPPLRPLLAIHLAPVSLAGLGLGLLGIAAASDLAAVLAGGLALVLLVALPWMTQAGFVPFWGAFTFPLAAFSSLLSMTAARHPAVVWAALPVLALASVAVPLIAWRVLRLWPGGKLARMTGSPPA